VRSFGDWNDPALGYLEVDFVADSGTSTAADFVQTMVPTGIATGWTECIPVVVREGGLTLKALARAQALFQHFNIVALAVDICFPRTFREREVGSFRCYRTHRLTRYGPIRQTAGRREATLEERQS
jgi:hypothetical protein